MKDDKVVHLSRKKSSLEDELLEIARLLSGEDSPVENSDDIHKPSTYVNGSGNIVGDGNTINNVIHFNHPVKKLVQVKTGDGVVDANQKHIIKTLIYEWVEMHNSIKKSSLTHQSAWSQLNNSMKVNSYHEIKHDDFSKSVKYLRSKIGALRNMASAPKKVTDWRSQTIKSVQARCSEMGWQGWRKEHMAKKFGKSSMTELNDAELQQLYQTVWSKK